jgi:C-terminal processing protease CtpA/Prc
VNPLLSLCLLLCCLLGTPLMVAGCASERGTIGAQLGQKGDGRLFIRAVPPGLAAAQAGLQPGDEITLIDGRDTRNFDEKALHKLLTGEVGDPVKLTVLRGDQVLHVTLRRTPAPRHVKSD